MLKIFTNQKVRSRMQSGPMGPYLSEIAAVLWQQGYARSTIRLHLRAIDHFSAWLLKQGLSLKDISNSIVDRYLKGLDRQFSPSCPGGRLSRKALGLPELVEFLRQQGVLRADVEQRQLTVAERWLADFDHHLDQVAGNAQRTRGNYLRYARRFLTECFGIEAPNWSLLEPEQVTEFVRSEASKLQPSSCGQPVNAIRALLRFLVSSGVIPQGLERAVPPVLTCRHSSLPRHITASEVERVIGACNPATPLGLRERAVITLLAHLGLRAGEVIRLKLEDIDWFEGRLIVRAGKNHRERSLPLSQEVGDVLVSYLRDARPATPHREIFLRWRPPFHRLRSSVTITALVAKALKRAGVKAHRPGAHILRHTLATQMACQGTAFKQIADILGHLSLASTSVYAKLDLESLSKVAMPWPGGAQ
jgi:site-specific recombinase XerD